MKKNFQNKAKGKSKYTVYEQMAYRQGVVERGIKNTNSRVFEAYQKGLHFGEVKKEKQDKPVA